MKKLFIYLFVIIYTPIFSQNSFITEIGNDSLNTALYDLIETSKGEFAIAGFMGNKNDSIGAYIAIVDSSGNLKKENLRYLKDSLWSYRGIKEIENNHYVLSSSITSKKGTGKSFILISEYDENLNLISEKKYKFPIDTFVIYKNYMRLYKDTILIFGGCKNETYYGNFIYKITPDSTIFYFSDSIYIHDLLIKDSFFYFSGYRNAKNNQIISRNNTEDLSTDTIFILDSLNSHCLGNFKTYFKEFSDTSFIFKYVNDDLLNCLLVFDNNFNKIKDTALLTEHGPYSPETKGIDYKYKNHIYYVNWSGTCYVTKVDSNLNIKWQKFLYTDYAMVTVGITATQDSGAIAFSVISDGHLKIKLIKFDKDGNYQPANIEDYNIKISDFVVYPNPADKILNIKKAVQVKNANFLLYNSNGKMVLRKNITQNITNLNISNLNTGVYIYNFLQKGKITDKGKIIIK